MLLRFLSHSVRFNKKSRQRIGGVSAAAMRPGAETRTLFEVNSVLLLAGGGNREKAAAAKEPAAENFPIVASGLGRNGTHFTMYLTYLLQWKLHSDRLAGNFTRFHGVRMHGTNGYIYFFLTIPLEIHSVKPISNQCRCLWGEGMGSTESKMYQSDTILFSRGCKRALNLLS